MAQPIRTLAADCVLSAAFRPFLPLFSPGGESAAKFQFADFAPRPVKLIQTESQP